MAEQVITQDEKKQGKTHLWLIVLLLVLALIAAVYVGGILYFATHTMPFATVNGEDASNISMEELAERLQGGIGDYSIQVSGEGVDFNVAAADIDVEVNGLSVASKAIAQMGPAEWPLQVSQTHDVTVDLTASYDETKLSQLVATEVQNFEEAARAEAENSPAVVFDEETQLFELSDRSAAYQINVDRLTAKVGAAVKDLEPSVAVDETDIDQSEETDATIDAANNLLAAAGMHLFLGDTDVLTLDASRIASFVTFDENGNPSLNNDAVVEWVNGDLAGQLDTVGIPRTYTRPDGKEVSVEDGAYGWQIDGDATAAELTDRINSGDASDYYIPCIQTAGLVNYGGKDWSGNWIDIDITEQHARLYNDAGDVLWEADVVTGNTDGTHETPQGTWYITSKETDTVLIGPEVSPGVTEWNTPVKYWFGVVGQRIGLHSAQWRGAFGGNIYTYSGSHGCINISEAKAAEVYDLIEVGMACVVHY